MRALLFCLPVLLAGCGSDYYSNSFSASQREILKQSQVEIARREPWANTAAIFVQNPDDFTRVSWKVKAGALDYSALSPYKGIYLVPGTERELQFNLDGCLTDYADRSRRCLTPVSYESTEMLTVPGK